MTLFQYNTMRLTTAPSEIATGTRKAWDNLFDAFGFDTFHPIEGRGIIMYSLRRGAISRSEAQAIMQRLVDRGFAIAP